MKRIGYRSTLLHRAKIKRPALFWVRESCCMGSNGQYREFWLSRQKFLTTTETCSLDHCTNVQSQPQVSLWLNIGMRPSTNKGVFEQIRRKQLNRIVEYFESLLDGATTLMTLFSVATPLACLRNHPVTIEELLSWYLWQVVLKEEVPNSWHFLPQP